MKLLLCVALLSVVTARSYRSEVWSKEREVAAGIIGGRFSSPLPETYLTTEQLPEAFTWCDKDGVNYCTMSRNQHLPQYCGSCWAHGAVSALGDRIKIARKAQGIDINLSVQHILNCGNAGTCHGGSIIGPYAWIHEISATGTGISYETSNPYQACSSDSKEGLCAYGNWSCNALNVARTCSTFSDWGGKCVGLNRFPNATVSEYGSVKGADNMAKEIFARGPISCGIDAEPTLKYQGGVLSAKGDGVNHVVSIVGWGKDQASGKQYWIARNNWGEYWGNMGYIYVEKGINAVNLEEECAWAVPGKFTESNFPCFEGGENCLAKEL